MEKSKKNYRVEAVFGKKMATGSTMLAENSMDREARCTTAHGVTKWTQLSN